MAVLSRGRNLGRQLIETLMVSPLPERGAMDEPKKTNRRLVCQGGDCTAL